MRLFGGNELCLMRGTMEVVGRAGGGGFTVAAVLALCFGECATVNGKGQEGGIG